MEIEREICIIPRRKWNSITNWLTENERRQASLERKNAYLKYMKELSTQLVAGNDSLKEAASKRLEAKRKEHEIREKIIVSDYTRIRQNQKIERDQIIGKYQRSKLISRTPTLELTRALREAQVLGEREEELKLKKAIKEKEKEMERKDQNELQHQWETSNIFHRKKEESRRCRLNEVKFEVWKQFQDNRKKKQEEYTDMVDQEREELQRMAEELEEKNRVRKARQLSNKKKALSLLKKAAEDTHHRRYSEKKHDQELYRVNEVINNALTTRRCHIKSKLKKETIDRVEQNEVVYVKYISQLPPMKPSEETIYQNGVRKNQEEFNRKMEEKRAKQKKFVEDKIKNYKEDMRQQKLKEEEEAELKRMEMMERYKKAEAMKYLDELNGKEEMKQKKVYGKYLLDQAEEQKNIIKLENKLENDYIAYSFSREEDHFVEYADEVMKYAKEKHWPTVPIKKAIQNYKKTQPLIQRKKTAY